jgi:hypothetical protein
MAITGSVDTWTECELSAEEQKKLDAVIEQSIRESDAGLGIPVERAIAEIRDKRRASRTQE